MYIKKKLKRNEKHRLVKIKSKRKRKSQRLKLLHT